jgi:hypothetical protein
MARRAQGSRGRRGRGHGSAPGWAGGRAASPPAPGAGGGREGREAARLALLDDAPDATHLPLAERAAELEAAQAAAGPDYAALQGQVPHTQDPLKPERRPGRRLDPRPVAGNVAEEHAQGLRWRLEAGLKACR